MAKKDAIVELIAYILPFIRLADIKIANDGTMYDASHGPIDGCFDASGGVGPKRILVFPFGYGEWNKIRKIETNEVFNTFVVKKHMLLLVSAFIRFLTSTYTEFEMDENGNMTSEVTSIEMSSYKEPSGLIHCQLVADKMEVLYEGVWPEEKMAMWLVCANALKDYFTDSETGKFDYANTPSEVHFLGVPNVLDLVPHINQLIERMGIERRRVFGEEKNTDEFSDIAVVEDTYEVREPDDSEFVFLDESRLPENFIIGIDDEKELKKFGGLSEIMSLDLADYGGLVIDTPQTRLEAMRKENKFVRSQDTELKKEQVEIVTQIQQPVFQPQFGFIPSFVSRTNSVDDDMVIS